MLYIYRRTNSTGARDLTEGILLQGTVARRTKGGALRGLQTGDAVVCWGHNFAAPAGIRTLNNVAPISKAAEIEKLTAAGVSTVKISRTRPVVAPAARAAFVEEPFPVPVRPNLNVAEAQEMLVNLTAYITRQTNRRRAWEQQPVIPTETWLPRLNHHIGGNDLLDTPPQPDFYTKKEDIVEEYRLHMFKGKSIRAGIKTRQATRPDGHTPAHDWIRSYDAGWIIKYEGFKSTKEMRDLAAKALKALGLDFGAVDIGKRRDGSLLVFEVNRAPGVEGGTVTQYAKHIIGWLNYREAQGE